MSRKAAEAPKAENHERWIVSYADMLTLLQTRSLEELRAGLERLEIRL